MPSTPTPNADPLRLALVGMGRMGQAIRDEALRQGCKVVASIDRHNLPSLDELSASEVDVCIEFTQREAAPQIVKRLLEGGHAVVSGSTGWEEELPALKALSEKQGALVWSANMSLSVNLLFALNRWLLQRMNALPEYDVFIEERHHRHKQDAPSGTALRLAQDVLNLLDRKTQIAPPDALQHRAILPHELSMAVTRAGSMAGEHRLVFAGPHDQIELAHVAHSRQGFVVGALAAARALAGKKGWHELTDLLFGKSAED